MIILYGINDNILIPNLYYLGVYQDESKIRAIQRNKYFGGLEPNPRKLIKQWCTFLPPHWELQKYI